MWPVRPCLTSPSVFLFVLRWILKSGRILGMGTFSSGSGQFTQRQSDRTGVRDQRCLCLVVGGSSTEFETRLFHLFRTCWVSHLAIWPWEKQGYFDFGLVSKQERTNFGRYFGNSVPSFIPNSQKMKSRKQKMRTAKVGKKDRKRGCFGWGRGEEGERCFRESLDKLQPVLLCPHGEKH